MNKAFTLISLLIGTLSAFLFGAVITTTLMDIINVWVALPLLALLVLICWYCNNIYCDGIDKELNKL